MSNYRRLISYIYAYEGGVKGRNVGFAKLETRNGQCRIQVSVRKIYVGSQDTGVYLLSGSSELLIGKIFLRNGAGEFRASVPVNQVAGTDQSIDQCYGLTIHSTDDSWQSYTTIWEDAVAHAAEVELAEAVSELMEEKEMKQVPETVISEKQLEDVVNNRQRSVVESIEEEIRAQEKLWETDGQNTQTPASESVESMQQVQSREEESENLVLPREGIVDEVPAQDAVQSVQQPVQDVVQSVQPPVMENPAQQPEWEQQQQRQLDILEAEEPAEDVEAGKLWNHFIRTYPKIQAFDYSGGCEILTIKPQDIGLLPREIWTYGNNSFLLHGYYNHRYLILARLNTPEGGARFLLGVPGHYYSNEKYMAAMFGFPNFVLSKMQPSGDGRFGYWYTDIRLGNG